MPHDDTSSPARNSLHAPGGVSTVRGEPRAGTGGDKPMTRTRRRPTPAIAARSWAFGIAIVLAPVACPHSHITANDPPRSATTVAPAPRPLTDLYGDRLPAGAVARLGSLRLRHLGLADFFLRPDGRSA